MLFYVQPKICRGMTTFATKDDVLTLLVQLGYLTYNSTEETVSIPNKEVSQEYVNAISTMNWYGVAGVLYNSAGISNGKRFCRHLHDSTEAIC